MLAERALTDGKRATAAAAASGQQAQRGPTRCRQHRNHHRCVTIVGPTFDPEELAGRELAALFGRAEARDFADVFALAQRFEGSVLAERAAEVDLGFGPLVLAHMMRTIDRFDDDELPIDEAASTRCAPPSIAGHTSSNAARRPEGARRHPLLTFDAGGRVGGGGPT